MLRGPLLYPTACEQWFDEMRSTRLRSAATRDTYGDVLRILQARHPGRRVNEFTEQMLVDHLLNPVAMTSDGLRPTRWAPNTILTSRHAIQSFFRWAARQGKTRAGWPQTNPAADLAMLVDVKKKKVRTGNWLSATQVRALFATCWSDDPLDVRDSVLLQTMFYLGLRCFEVAVLDWGMLDLGDDPTLTFVGKGQKIATLGIPVQLVEVLIKWRHLYEQGVGRPLTPHDPVLCRTANVAVCFETGERKSVMLWGRRLVPRSVRPRLHVRGAQIGVPELAPHDLRRSYANILNTMRDETGRKVFDIEEVSKMMRHESVATTQVYLSDAPGAAQERAGRFVL